MCGSAIVFVFITLMGVQSGEDGETKAQAHEGRVEGRVESDADGVQISIDHGEQNGVASRDGQVDEDHHDDKAAVNQPAAVALLATDNADGDDGVEVRVCP